MTPEQEARCDALAKRIAELSPHGEWAIAGMSCRDAGSGADWRRVWCAWSGVACGGVTTLIRDAGDVCEATESLRDAIASGPDWRDLATLNSLLGDDGEVARDSGEWWANVNGCACDGETRPEAILAAKVAELEAKNAAA